MEFRSIRRELDGEERIGIIIVRIMAIEDVAAWRGRITANDRSNRC
jgi:hypothetical protein